MLKKSIAIGIVGLALATAPTGCSKDEKGSSESSTSAVETTSIAGSSAQYEMLTFVPGPTVTPPDADTWQQHASVVTNKTEWDEAWTGVVDAPTYPTFDQETQRVVLVFGPVQETSASQMLVNDFTVDNGVYTVTTSLSVEPSHCATDSGPYVNYAMFTTTDPVESVDLIVNMGTLSECGLDF